MTIKQLGGVFGRNPTFNDVTIEGQLTFDGDIDINSDLKVSGELEVVGNINSTGRMRAAGGSDQGTQLNMWTTAGGDGSLAAYQLVFNTGPNGARVEGARFTPSGNLAFVSGKGIDFSATAGAGTSELLDDYEEGDWTPEYAPASGAFGSITYDTAITGGKYTKVGNLVHIQGGIRTDAITVGTASGGIRLSGLPFPVIASGTGQDGWSTLTVGQAVAFAGDVPSLGSIVAGQSYIELQYRSAANGATIDLNVADLDTGASDNLMRFSATYISG